MSSNDAPGLQRPPTTVAVCFYNIPQLTDAEFRSQFKVPCDLTRLVILKKLTHVRTQATVFTAKLRSCDRALAEAYVQEIQNLAFQSGVSVYVQYEEVRNRPPDFDERLAAVLCCAHIISMSGKYSCADIQYFFLILN